MCILIHWSNDSTLPWSRMAVVNIYMYVPTSGDLLTAWGHILRLFENFKFRQTMNISPYPEKHQQTGSFQGNLELPTADSKLVVHTVHLVIKVWQNRFHKIVVGLIQVLTNLAPLKGVCHEIVSLYFFMNRTNSGPRYTDFRIRFRFSRDIWS